MAQMIERKRRATTVHGSPVMYNDGCRCDVCRAANTARAYRNRAVRTGKLSDIPHGTASGYQNWLCRCSDCRKAWARADDYAIRGCSVEGCDRGHRARGLCNLHWCRLRATLKADGKWLR